MEGPDKGEGVDRAAFRSGQPSEYGKVLKKKEGLDKQRAEYEKKGGAGHLAQKKEELAALRGAGASL